MNLAVDPKLLEPLTAKAPGLVVSLWQRKTANVFRGVIELQCSSNNAAHVANEVRHVVTKEFTPGFFVPFAFGTVLRFRSHSPNQEQMGTYVDTKARSQGTWQWIIVTDESLKHAYGVHTWVEGYLTPVYVELLKQLEANGYKCQTTTKSPGKFFTRIWSINAGLVKARSVFLVLGAALSLVVIAGKVLWGW